MLPKLVQQGFERTMIAHLLYHLIQLRKLYQKELARLGRDTIRRSAQYVSIACEILYSWNTSWECQHNYSEFLEILSWLCNFNTGMPIVVEL